MSETYTKDLITIGKNLYVVEPIQNDQERLKYLLNCAQYPDRDPFKPSGVGHYDVDGKQQQWHRGSWQRA